MSAKSPLQSKTINFHLAMVLVQSVGAGFAAYQPFLDPLNYALAASMLGVVQSVGGVYLRFLTETPIK